MLSEKKEYWKNGNLKRIYFKNKYNELEGEYREFYENGNLKVIRNYKNGELYGIIINYYPNSTIKVIGNYKKNKKEGVVVFYNSQKNILRKDYYISNKLIFSSNFNKNVKSNEVDTKIYSDYIKNCSIKTIYENDSPILEILYIDGKPQGKLEYDIDNGILKSNSIFINPKLSNDLTRWNSLRKTFLLNNFSFGKLDGTYEYKTKKKSRERKPSSRELEL